MAEDKKKSPEKKTFETVNQGAKVIKLDFEHCRAESCKAKISRAEFCEEHFDWFKAGLIKRTGERVPDFQKKFLSYQNQPKKKVA